MWKRWAGTSTTLRRYWLYAGAGASTAGIFLVVNSGVVESDSRASPYSYVSVERIKAGCDGALRSSRAIFTFLCNIADYKYSLRGMVVGSDDYRRKLSEAIEDTTILLTTPFVICNKVFVYEVHLRSARRIMKLCETNKGFYVKAGQFIGSLRHVPKEYSSTLSSLQDQAIPCDFETIKEVLMENFGKDLPAIFLKFDKQPVAAASIAQVHHAVLKNFQEVAVKVQYPCLEDLMEKDIRTMSILSKTLSMLFPDYQFEWIVPEFEKAISAELDFVQEARNSERAFNNFKNHKIIKVPQVYWELTTKKVLTMQFFHGHKVDDVQFLKETGINPKQVAHTLMEAFAKMIFVHGFLHGDPHPGNVLISPRGGKKFYLVLLDHGIYRELNEDFRLDYCRLWKAMIVMDTQEILQLGRKLGAGKYAKYFPVIFTGRTIDSKSSLGRNMSAEEKRSLRRELNALTMGDLASFLESLPRDFLTILRTDGLLRSIIGNLGVSQRARLLAYAKHAIHGLATKRDCSGTEIRLSIIPRLRASISFVHIRMLIEALELYSRVQDIWKSFNNWSDFLRMVARLLHERLFPFILTAS